MNEIVNFEYLETFDFDFVPISTESLIDNDFDKNDSYINTSDGLLNQNYSKQDNQVLNLVQFDLNALLESSNDSINENVFLCSNTPDSREFSPTQLSPNFDTSVIQNYDFTKTPSSPVKFVLQDTTLDDMKISAEVILDFDSPKVFSDKSHNDNELLTVHSISQNDTLIDLHDTNELNDINDSSDSEEMLADGCTLTEEEKSVYLKEGYKIPVLTPLTKSEEKILKLVRRKIRNKKSAHISRERKKKYVDGLEKRVDLCTKENEELHNQVQTLKTKNTELMKELYKMQALISTLVAKNKKSSTAVLFVSFLITFCVFPNIDIEETNESLVLKYDVINPISRKLLSVEPPKNIVEINRTDQYEYIWDVYKSRYDLHSN